MFGCVLFWQILRNCAVLTRHSYISFDIVILSTVNDTISTASLQHTASYQYCFSSFFSIGQSVTYKLLILGKHFISTVSLLQTGYGVICEEVAGGPLLILWNKVCYKISITCGKPDQSFVNSRTTSNSR